MPRAGFGAEAFCFTVLAGKPCSFFTRKESWSVPLHWWHLVCCSEQDWLLFWGNLFCKTMTGWSKKWTKTQCLVKGGRPKYPRISDNPNAGEKQTVSTTNKTTQVPEEQTAQEKPELHFQSLGETYGACGVRPSTTCRCTRWVLFRWSRSGTCCRRLRPPGTSGRPAAAAVWVPRAIWSRWMWNHCNTGFRKWISTRTQCFCAGNPTKINSRFSNCWGFCSFSYPPVSSHDRTTLSISARFWQNFDWYFQSLNLDLLNCLVCVPRTETWKRIFWSFETGSLEGTQTEYENATPRELNSEPVFLLAKLRSLLKSALVVGIVEVVTYSANQLKILRALDTCRK